MKSFKDYLTESKKVYEFKVKVAGDYDKVQAGIKTALSQFHVSSVSEAKSTPIQEHHQEFPEQRNVRLSIYDVTTDYPATSFQVRDLVAAGCSIPLNCVVVRNMAEEREYQINHQYDERSGKAVSGTFADPDNFGHLVNEKHKFDLLKELGKTKHGPAQYKGINDQILAKGTPKPGKQEEQSIVPSNNKSVIHKTPNPAKLGK